MTAAIDPETFVATVEEWAGRPVGHVIGRRPVYIFPVALPTL